LKIVLQRVSESSVCVEGKEIARISRGLLALVGIEVGDNTEIVRKLAKKVAELRFFEDEQGKMNLSVQEVSGEILVVSQFTLAADLMKGRRPSFDHAEKPEKAVEHISEFVAYLKESGVIVQEGQFAAKMEVKLINDGPVTFILSG